jgi:PTH1 family peptidyl-tRNA hydrolase
MLLVVGLGNPGREYASHRHTVGFMAVDELARREKADAFREKFSAVYAKAEIGGTPAILLKPMTYMNESGRSVQPAMAFFKVAPKDIIVLHDELDLPFGEVRLKFAGGHAGHNGLRSIVASVGTGDFGRVRIGIGRPPPGFRGEVADYVLSSFDSIERSSLPDVLGRAVDSVLDIAHRGIEAAMNARNTRPKPKKPKPAAPPATEGEPRPLNGSGGGGALLPKPKAEP